MEVCAITGVQIPNYTDVVLLPIVKVRDIGRDNSCLYTKGAHCYFEPVTLPIFGQTEMDTVFEATEDNHLENLAGLFGSDDSFELVENILQGGELPPVIGCKNSIDGCFYHVFILRSVWDSLGGHPRLNVYLNASRVVNEIESRIQIVETTRKKIESANSEDVRILLEERLQFFETMHSKTGFPYAGLNDDSVRFYGKLLKTHYELFEKNNLIMHWMNAFGKMLMPCFCGLEDFKAQHIKLTRAAYNSVKSSF